MVLHNVLFKLEHVCYRAGSIRLGSGSRSVLAAEGFNVQKDLVLGHLRKEEKRRDDGEEGRVGMEYNTDKRQQAITLYMSCFYKIERRWTQNGIQHKEETLATIPCTLRFLSS